MGRNTHTGGLLRQVPPEAIVIFKDFTSILSLGRDARSGVLSAFREIYDGSWGRSTGGGGGRTEEWAGRWVIIAAVTTAIDTTERDVSAKMGDRFAIIRMRDDKNRRRESGQMSSVQQGDEAMMRLELGAAVSLLFKRLEMRLTVDPSEHMPSADSNKLLSVVDVVTRARSAVEYSHSGTEVVYSHAPEAPTRLLKQLMQLWRGAVAIGRTDESALWLSFRVALESMPPMRLAILQDLAMHGRGSLSSIAKRQKKPTASIRRELQALHHLGVLDMDEVPTRLGGHATYDYRLRHDAVDAFARAILYALAP